MSYLGITVSEQERRENGQGKHLRGLKPLYFIKLRFKLPQEVSPLVPFSEPNCVLRLSCVAEWKRRKEGLFLTPSPRVPCVQLLLLPRTIYIFPQVVIIMCRVLRCIRSPRILMNDSWMSSHYSYTLDDIVLRRIDLVSQSTLRPRLYVRACAHPTTCETSMAIRRYLSGFPHKLAICLIHITLPVRNIYAEPHHPSLPPTTHTNVIPAMVHV